MSQFEIINEFQDTKGVVIRKRDGDTNTIFFMVKQPFNLDESRQILYQIENNPKDGLIMENDKFKKYTIEFPLKNATTSYSVDLISPATQKDIQKYQTQKVEFFTETPILYKNVTLPFIKSMPQSEFQWIKNIINGVSEQENVLMNEDEYISVLDMKWDRQRMDQVYGLVLVKDSSLYSVRSLNASHIPLLEKISKQTTEIIQEKFGVCGNELITFVHYVPSFWHFHVHFCSIHSPLYDSQNVVIGRAIILSDVIQNLRVKSDYYEKTSLRIRMNTLHPLYKQLKAYHE
ncbi:Scavenger mRNA decapping enzyme [Entamoeba marina]